MKGTIFACSWNPLFFIWFSLNESAPDSFSDLEKTGSDDQTSIQNDNKGHREHRIKVDMATFATGIKEHIARAGVFINGIHSYRLPYMTI